MIHTYQQNSEAWMGEFKDGFHRTQASGSAKAMFDECAREDQGRLYRIGRSFVARAERALKEKFNVRVKKSTSISAEQTKKKKSAKKKI